MSLRRQIVSRAMEIFGGWGYREIQIPILDYFDSLKDGLDPREVARSFRFIDRRGNLMVLQPDLTPAIAKVYAYQLEGAPLPLRFSYATKTVRVERSFAGEQLESSQVGVEMIGARGLVADMEVLLVAVELLDALGLDDVQLNVADHLTAKLLLSASGAPSRIRGEVRAAIVARDPDEVRVILRGLGVRDIYVEAMSALAELREGTEQVARIRQLLARHVKVSERLDYLTAVARTLDELGLAERVRLDLGELGGGSYYTGLGFNVVSEGVGRELGRGGRYDELIGKFGQPTPAVGFSLSQEALVELLHGRFSPRRRKPLAEDTVYVANADPVKGLQAALERRRLGKETHLVSRFER